MEIRPYTTILFQGDSITDSGRSRKNDEILGTGYAMMVAAWFSAVHPERNARFLNRGVSGNGIRELKDRWQKDCLDLKPDIVSILIGINDSLGKYLWSKPTPVENFEAYYVSILKQTQSSVNAEIVLLEPFMLSVSSEHIGFREDLNPKIEVVRRLSKKFKTFLVPLDEIFAKAAKKREPSYWAKDGIHPTLAGHALIAQSWLECLKWSERERQNSRPKSLQDNTS
jgi:lysophospholipase L1-like esterase